jgi:hypothetical protein
MIVRALAVQQPWAGLIANGTKTTEWRTWSTPYRGPILIVASRGRNREATEEWQGKLTETNAAKGATLCVVELVDVAFNESESLFVWKLASPRPVPVTPIKGKLNLYNETVPDSWAPQFAPRPGGVTSKRDATDGVPTRRGPSPSKKAAAAPKQKRRAAGALGTRSAYEAALRTWRAAGAPDGPLSRAVGRAKRAWRYATTQRRRRPA